MINHKRFLHSLRQYIPFKACRIPSTCRGRWRHAHHAHHTYTHHACHCSSNGSHCRCSPHHSLCFATSTRQAHHSHRSHHHSACHCAYRCSHHSYSSSVSLLPICILYKRPSRFVIFLLCPCFVVQMTIYCFVQILFAC